MDPNEALYNAREAVASIHNAMDEDGGLDSFDLDLDDVAQLADAFKALDEWISKGGFLPVLWSKVRHT